MKNSKILASILHSSKASLSASGKAPESRHMFLLIAYDHSTCIAKALPGSHDTENESWDRADRLINGTYEEK